MAVYAAHLTRTLQGTPSIFQVTAQEALGATVKPALKKVIEYLAALYPDRFGWSVQWYDELYLLLDLSLQYHYLKHYAASFSESFYGLLRVPLASTSEFSSGPRLSARLERASLALLVLGPYVRCKLEDRVEKWRGADEDGRLGKSFSDRARKAAIKIYSILHFISESIKLVQLARYLTGKSRSPSPGLWALGLTLKDAPPAEMSDEYTWRDLATSLFTGKIGAAAVTFPMVGSVLLRGVEYGAFLVQFLRWWESRGAVADSGGLPVPPPPERDERAFRCKNRCPLCLQSWKIPTVLPVSGYIFCYVCISRHLRARRACPVTRLPAAEDSVVRLYVDN